MRQGPSWRLSIATTRDLLSDRLEDNSSLRAVLEASVVTAYRRARRNAAVETGLAETSFPKVCPFSVEQVLAEEFWPEAAGGRLLNGGLRPPYG